MSDAAGETRQGRLSPCKSLNSRLEARRRPGKSTAIWEIRDKARSRRDAPSSDPWFPQPFGCGAVDRASALPTAPQQQQAQHRISGGDLTIGKVETMSPDLSLSLHVR